MLGDFFMCAENEVHDSAAKPEQAPAAPAPEDNENELVLAAYARALENERFVLYQYRGHAGAAELAQLIP
jgi:hypothetical protein